MTTPTLRLKVVTSAEKPGRQSVFIELVSQEKGKDIGIFGEWLKTEKGKRPQMELEKFDFVRVHAIPYCDATTPLRCHLI